MHACGAEPCLQADEKQAIEQRSTKQRLTAQQAAEVASGALFPPCPLAAADASKIGLCTLKDPAVVVLAHDRPDDLKLVLRSLTKLPQIKRFK